MRGTACFDFSQSMFRLCDDLVRRLPELSHVRMSEIAVTFAQTRRRVSHGLQAKLTPLRFENGALTTFRYGRQWTIPRMFRGETELLYILTFYLPRFLEHSFREKMITIVHELYHISPDFNGDIRRLEGRYHVHSHSQKEYDEEMAKLAEQYLRMQPPPELYEFLQDNYESLRRQHGTVVGLKVPIPKLIPLPRSA